MDRQRRGRPERDRRPPRDNSNGYIILLVIAFAIYFVSYNKKETAEQTTSGPEKEGVTQPPVSDPEKGVTQPPNVVEPTTMDPKESAARQAVLVSTTSGPVEGFKTTSITGKVLQVFLGIPYAAPPIGGLRFKPPVAVAPSKGLIKAHQRSRACLQVNRLFESEQAIEMAKLFIPPKEDTSEDCLYVNVWAPSMRNNEKLAVMVWIHGGSYEAGTGNSMIYDGQVLASEGVVVVSMNYRLNVFGFLTVHPEEIPGNVGLMDQAFALKWVQDNIDNFGGDSKRVTIFGESAGGGSVGHHVLLPSSQGLFQRAILQSGTATAPWSYSTKNVAVETAEKFIEIIGCNSSNHIDTIKCLRETDANILAEAVADVKSSAFIPFNPSVDGVYITEDPNIRESQLKFNKDVDILMGTTNDDGFLFVFALKVVAMTEESFLSNEDFSNHLKGFIRSDNLALNSFFKFLYTDWEIESDDWTLPMIDLFTDLSFACPAVNVADRAAANGNKVYYYEFEHRPASSKFPSWVRVSHADDLGPVFGLPLLMPDRFSAEDAQFSERVRKYWTQFAKTGNPNFGDNGIWPLYALPQKKALSLQMNEHVINGVRVQRCAFINKFIPKLVRLLSRNNINL